MVTIMEEYANSGLEYLENRYSKGDHLENSHYMFIDLYKNA